MTNKDACPLVSQHVRDQVKRRGESCVTYLTDMWAWFNVSAYVLLSQTEDSYNVKYDY